MSTNKKPSSGINYYDVFGLDRKASSKDIRKKYRELVNKYHPDKNPDSSKLFEVIQKAWECLNNDEKRRLYDIHLTNKEKVKKNDHYSLRQQFDDYSDLSKDNPKSAEQAQLEYKKAFKELNDKHGLSDYGADQIKIEPISKEEAARRMDNLLLEREHNDIEYSQTKIFEDGEKFDLKKFNAVFNKHKTKKNNQIVPANQVNAFNNNEFGSSFTMLEDFDDPVQSTHQDTKNYSAVNDDGSDIVDFDKSNVKGIINEKTNDVDADFDFKKKYDDMLKQREMQTHELNNMPFEKFTTDPNQSYMFTHEIGSDPTGHITFDDDLDSQDSEVVDACNRLLELERK
jgi:curved DNA-binding protein CbpA